ncbi:unnamed protein product [Rotaria sp. Silwood2]|nr:unnamed protein product [Rotaria sp. Silwood2]CAF4386966.1 unnamed protein product [Rotaria sp. Silwood2]
MSTDYDNKQIILSLNEFSITNDLVRILFEINADPQCDNSKPFANITSLTCNPQQQQVLFTVGSVFKLIDIQQDKKSGVWIINMILTNIKKEYDDKNLISCGHILQKMGRYDEADTYFNRLLRELPQNHEDISKCYYTLGHLSFLKSNYDLSLNWFQKLLKILKPNDPILADTYYSIGCVYQNMYDYNQALQYYNQALLIWKESDGNDEPFQMAECLNNMGCIYEIEKCYSKALACHQQALSIRDKFQADLGSSYNNIGNIYLCLGEYNAAIENYDYAYKIKSKSRSSQDPSLATTLRNMALAYEEDGNFIEALKYYKKASLAFASIFSATHTYYIEIQEDIQRVSSLMESKIIE